MRTFFNIMLWTCCICIISCQQVNNGSEDCYLSSEDSLSIVNGVITATDSWAVATSNLDFKKAIEFYDSSADLLLFDFGKEYTSRDSLFNHMAQTSLPLERIEINWIKRVVTPLKKDKAYIYSNFISKMHLKSGGEFQSSVYLSGIITKSNHEWKLSQGQANGVPLKSD